MTARLSPEHLGELNSSRISTELIDGRGYITVHEDRREELAGMGCPAWAMRDSSAWPALVLPMYRPRTGDYLGFQFKPAVPQLKPGTDKPVKYASPKGMGNRLDVHPLCRDRVADPSAPLWVTEGVKKSDALASRGLAVVTLTGVWNWRRSDGALADWEDVPMKGRTVIVCFDSDAPVNPQVRAAMVRLVSWLRSRRANAKYLVVPASVGGVPVKGADDYLAAGGTVEQLQSAMTDRAPAQPVNLDAAFTDAFLTDTVCAEVLGGAFLYARGLGWMRYDGSRWTEATDSLVVEEIRVWAKDHWDSVVEEYKTDQTADVKGRMREWRQVLGNSRLKALASLARGPLHAEASEFDAHPDLLNCPNGVVDLRTGELMDPDPSYRFTKVAGVDYDPDADDPDFRAALRALPDDVQSWYRTRIGQAFTGYMPPDDMMIVQQGGGENGKSTLAVPIRRAAGSYAVLVSDRVIMGSMDQHPTELMELKGARYAYMEETPEARQLNVQQLKRVVGTPQITARKIRQDSVTFDATHSLFVNTNFAPAVAETDHATWRRLAMVRFPFTFRSSADEVITETDRLGDQGLRQRCATRTETAQAALRWAVLGAVEWYRAGMVFGPVPGPVTDDTREWRRTGDLIMAFAGERLAFETGATATTAELHQAFGEWLAPTGHKPWTQRLFTDRFAAHEEVARGRAALVRRKVNGSVVRRWEGVRIVQTQAENPVSPSNNPFK